MVGRKCIDAGIVGRGLYFGERCQGEHFSEIVLGKPEGIKSDWSFHQHGPQQQMGNYGLSFLSNMCLYVEIFAHTPLAMSLSNNGRCCFLSSKKVISGLYGAAVWM